MASQVTRYKTYESLKQTTLTNVLASTPEIPFSEFAGMIICVPSGNTLQTLTFYCAPRTGAEPDPNTPANQPQPAQNYYLLTRTDGSNLPVTIDVQGGSNAGGSFGQCYDLSPLLSAVGLFSAGSLKVVTTQAILQCEISLTS